MQGQQRRRVRAEAHERALAERDVAREAGDDVPAARHDREEEAEEQHSLPVEAVGVERKYDEPHGSERKRSDVRAAAVREPLASLHAVATSSRVREPSSPCGRSNRTTKITTYATAVCHCGEMYAVVNVSPVPIRTAPIVAPARLPMPPSTMIPS